jgi:hypothetical protein
VSDEIKLKEKISRGQQADQWLNHPLFRSAITEIKADLFSTFEKSKFKDTDDREEIWRKIQSLNAIVARMERHIRDGDNAHKTLLQRLKEKISR